MTGASEVLIRLTTKIKDDKLQVAEDEIVIPANSARYQLSELINSLLDTEKPVPFDFLVDAPNSSLASSAAKKQKEECVIGDGANRVFLRTSVAQ